MKWEKDKFPHLWFGIIVAVIMISIGFLPIPSRVKSVITNILIGIYLSISILGRETVNKRRSIIANIVLWCGIIAASLVLLH
ncbi:MAG: hypothetical protein P9L97_08395 [Candidatus Tenebribacter davisii]|nr:hypothetical protein [Candidatus Tenebribacter davisii]